MKFGIRKRSYTKSIGAYKGQAKRKLKKALIPGYGKKGTGFFKNPKKALYNKVYNKTSVDIRKLGKSKRSKKKASQTTPTRVTKTRSTQVNRNTLTPEQKELFEMTKTPFTLFFCGILGVIIGMFTQLFPFLVVCLLMVFGCAIWYFIDYSKAKKELQKRKEESEFSDEYFE